MAVKLWKDILGKNGISIGSDEIIEKIINELFTIDKIDPKIFISNYTILLTGKIGNIRDLFRVQHNHLSEPSASIRAFDSPIKRAKAFPLWFIAAYPDVILWFHEWQRNLLRLYNRDYNLLAFESANLFGIKIRDLSGNKISYTTAVKRGFYVWINGLGMGLPIIPIFTMTSAYNRLKRNRITSWDEACGTKVLYSKISIFRVILFIIIFVICMIFSSALYGGI